MSRGILQKNSYIRNNGRRANTKKQKNAIPCTQYQVENTIKDILQKDRKHKGNNKVLKIMHEALGDEGEEEEETHAGK